MTVSITLDRHRRTLFAAIMATVAMLFVAFAAAYLERRAMPQEWVRIPVPRLAWLNLLVLAAASAAVEAYRRKGTAARRLTALGVAGLFVVLQVVVWMQCRAAGAGLASSAHASFFFILSGLHALHLLGGMAALLWRDGPRPLIAAYWHFLGFVWIGLLSMMTFA